MPSAPSPVYRRALLALVALQCLLILAFVLRGLAAPGPLGPRLPAVQGDTLWLESHGGLHQFNSDGKRLRRIDLPALGLTSPTSLHFTAEANVLWTHDQGRVHRCDLEHLRCAPVDLPELSDTDDYRWVRVSDDASQITVSDASRHRVLVYRRDDPAGHYALAQTHDTHLRFPNQTLQVGPALWIADTNNHRISQITAPAQSGQAGPAREDFPIAHAALRLGRWFPFAMARDPQERLWVLAADLRMRNADLLLMDRHLRPERVVPISPDQDPNAIVLFQQHLLLTDMTGFTVHRLDLNGRALAPFGDQAFRTELAASERQARWVARLPVMLIGSICVLLVLGLWLARKSGELAQMQDTPSRMGQASAPSPVAATTVKAAPAAAPHPSGGAVTIVSAVQGRTRTRRRMLLGAQAAATVLTFSAACLYLLPVTLGRECAPGVPCPTSLRLLTLFALVAVPLLLASQIRHVLALDSARIGTDGVRVQVRIGKRRYKALAENVTLTRQQLLIGLHVVPLRPYGAPLFDEDALRRDFVDRLPQLNVSDGFWPIGLVGHYWKFNGWQGRAILIAGAAGIVILAGLRFA